MIFSIGYGSTPFSRFVDILKANGIKILIDVRGRPYSKWSPAYSIKELAKNLEKEGIEYKWYKDLNGFDKERSPAYYKRINDVKALGEKKNVVLMCCELDPDKCHRKNKLGKDIDNINHIVIGKAKKEKENHYFKKAVEKKEEKEKKSDYLPGQILLF